MRPVAKSDDDYVLENIQAYARDELLPRVRAVYADANLVTTAVGAVDGLEPMTNAEAVALTSALTGRNDTGLVSFGTEAGLFQEMGIATVVCDPGRIEQAYRPHEYVEQDQLSACLNMLDNLGDKLAA